MKVFDEADSAEQSMSRCPKTIFSTRDRTWTSRLGDLMSGTFLSKLTAFDFCLPKQLARINTKRPGYPFDDLERNVSLPIFEIGGVGPVNIGSQGKAFLTEALCSSQPPNCPS